MRDPSPSDVIKPEVRGLTAYTLKHFDAEVKLDQNENPYELPAEFKREVVDRVLPEPGAAIRSSFPRRSSGPWRNLPGGTEEGILVGNGSNELIQASLSVTLGPGRRLAVPQPTFTLYKLMATTLQAEVDQVFLDPENLTVDTDKLVQSARNADVVVICSPNNPTGNVLERDALIAVLQNAKGIVLVDEAYHEFSGQTAVPLLADSSRILLCCEPSQKRWPWPDCVSAT